jgi:hypothetical protein
MDFYPLQQIMYNLSSSLLLKLPPHHHMVSVRWRLIRLVWSPERSTGQVKSYSVRMSSPAAIPLSKKSAEIAAVASFPTLQMQSQLILRHSYVSGGDAIHSQKCIPCLYNWFIIGLPG